MKQNRIFTHAFLSAIFAVGFFAFETAHSKECSQLFFSDSLASTADVRLRRINAILDPAMARNLSETDREIMAFYEASRSLDFGTLPTEAIAFRKNGGMFVSNLGNNRSLLVQFRDARRRSDRVSEQLSDMATRANTSGSHVLDIVIATPFREARSYLHFKMGYGNMPVGTEQQLVEAELRPLRATTEKIRAALQTPEIAKVANVSEVSTYNWENPTRMGHAPSYLFTRFAIVLNAKQRPTPDQIETILKLIENNAATAP